MEEDTEEQQLTLPKLSACTTKARHSKLLPSSEMNWLYPGSYLVEGDSLGKVQAPQHSVKPFLLGVCVSRGQGLIPPAPPTPLSFSMVWNLPQGSCFCLPHTDITKMAHPAQPSVCMCQVKVKYPQTLATLLRRHGFPKLTALVIPASPTASGKPPCPAFHVCLGSELRSSRLQGKACQLSHVPEAELHF